MGNAAVKTNGQTSILGGKHAAQWLAPPERAGSPTPELVSPPPLPNLQVVTTPKVKYAAKALGEAMKTRISDPDLRVLLDSIGAACVDIATSLRTGAKGYGTGRIGEQNKFGDNQLEVDVASDKAVFDRLRRSGVCALASSEETPEEVRISEGGKFSVAFDPLDGSSIVDANFSVGLSSGSGKVTASLAEQAANKKLL